MKTSFLTILILTLSFVSCNKDEGTNSVLFQTWEAKEFMSIESVAYPKNENTRVLLTFNRSGSYHLKLDINSCGGNFATGKNNLIELESPACTEACCDSKFSEKLASTISKVTSFDIEGKTLKLNVPKWGYIECELVE
jgi:hypothetical protein